MLNSVNNQGSYYNTGSDMFKTGHLTTKYNPSSNKYQELDSTDGNRPTEQRNWRRSLVNYENPLYPPNMLKKQLSFESDIIIDDAGRNMRSGYQGYFDSREVDRAKA